jgi:predicted MPP superfamily phosphohydrolase
MKYRIERRHAVPTRRKFIKTLGVFAVRGLSLGGYAFDLQPDIFPSVADRVSLTLSGHTHGGQVRITNDSPVLPPRYRSRYAYGHIVETEANLTTIPKHLIVSEGGVGCSIAPVRFGVPPEINLIEFDADI